jgi:hypothetical protein
MTRPSWIAWIPATVVAYAVGLGFSTWLVGTTARPLSGVLGGILFVLFYGAAIGVVVSAVQLAVIPRGGVSWRAWIGSTLIGAALGLALGSVVAELLANLIDPSVNLILSEGAIQCSSGAIVGLGIGIAQWRVLRPVMPKGRRWILMTAVGGALGYGLAAVVLELIEIAPLRAALVPSFGGILGLFIGAAQGLVLRARA